LSALEACGCVLVFTIGSRISRFGVDNFEIERRSIDRYYIHLYNGHQTVLQLGVLSTQAVRSRSVASICISLLASEDRLNFCVFGVFGKFVMDASNKNTFSLLVNRAYFVVNNEVIRVNYTMTCNVPIDITARFIIDTEYFFYYLPECCNLKTSSNSIDSHC